MKPSVRIRVGTQINNYIQKFVYLSVKKDPRNIIIFVLMAVCIVMGILLFQKKPVQDTGQKIAQIRLDSIAKENTALKKEIDFQIQEKARFKSKSDSLALLSPKIKETYKKEANEIDNKNVRELISGFDQLFSNANIK